ncbi:prolyl oligopeptidase family serine peptidase [Chitinimonas sp.]|uniref:S9 family peptidase n=1 Tax=Chitinimonas sp. TaxID=1934313 RepID=UPI0035AE7A15
MRSLWSPLLLAALIGMSGMPAWAEAPAVPKIALENFARNAKFSRPVLSKDRKFMAFMTEANNRRQAAVWDLEKDKITLLTNFTKQNAMQVRWATNNRLLIALDHDGNESYGVYAINRDGSNFRVLVEPPHVQGLTGSYVAKYVSIEKTIKDSENEVLVSANDRSARVPDLYRMDINTGKRTLVSFDRPAETRSWVLDSKDVPRVATSWDKADKKYVTWYRKDEKSPWTELFRRAAGEHSITPLSFTKDDKTLYVLSNLDRDTEAVYTYDPEAKKLGKLLFEAPDNYDMGTDNGTDQLRGSTNPDGGIIFDPESEEIIGYTYEGAKPTTVWIDEKYKAIQAAIDEALPGRYNRFRPAKEGNRILVTSRSDRHPGTYFWFDPKANTLEKLYEIFPDIHEEQMAETKPIEYTARDGLRIRGYLTLPPGREAKNLPTIIHPHGGPWARDTWGYNPDVQFLANRGYAVLQMDYRISTGYGAKHFEAGFRQIGGAMQDDKTDGLNWLVKQGITDPKRVCIFGGSYGGYATLWGVTKDPDLYRCGINEVGVSDWEIILRGLWYSGGSAYGPDELSKRVGDIDNPQDKPRLDATNPVKLAKRIKAPLLNGYGLQDPRVPIEHLRVMESALRSEGKTFESVVYDNEGHGWRNPENRLDWYKRMEAFLNKYNPAY